MYKHTFVFRESLYFLGQSPLPHTQMEAKWEVISNETAVGMERPSSTVFNSLESLPSLVTMDETTNQNSKPERSAEHTNIPEWYCAVTKYLQQFQRSPESRSYVGLHSVASAITSHWLKSLWNLAACYPMGVWWHLTIFWLRKNFFYLKIPSKGTFSHPWSLRPFCWSSLPRIFKWLL